MGRQHRLLLAVGTIMGAALSDDGSFDGCAAKRTGFAFALIDAELILEMSIRIDPIE